MWQLNGTEAHFESDRCQGVIDLSVADFVGLHRLSVMNAGEAISLANTGLLRLEARGNSIEETYVRGPDFVATLAESERSPFRMQVYWRALTEEDYFGFETIVSVQTSRLDVSPQLAFQTRCHDQPKQLDARSAAINLTAADLTYVEIAHSSNHDETRAQGNAISHHLFSGHLEKGVIRRARICGVFVPTATADSFIADIRDRFERSAPPLTT